jgi:predicted GTPase
VILVPNKWDLVEKDDMTAPGWEKKVRERIPFLQWVPFLFISALTGQRVRKASTWCSRCSRAWAPHRDPRGQRVLEDWWPSSRRPTSAGRR